MNIQELRDWLREVIEWMPDPHQDAYSVGKRDGAMFACSTILDLIKDE